MCRSLFAFRRLVWSTAVTVGDLHWWCCIHLVQIFSTVLACLYDLFPFFFVSLFFSLFSFLLYNSRRERKVKKINKKTSEAHQSFGNNITGRVRKISMIWIQRYEGRLPTITGVRYTSRLKASDIQHIWTTCEAHFTHCS
jgi:hypothetical protein